MRRIGTVVAVVVGLLVAEAANADVSSYAHVQEDGSLSVAGQRVRLQGISIPPSDRICGAPDMPATCGTRSVLQLIRKIGAEFVHCIDLGRDGTGAILGRCTVQGEDLAGWMVLNGWAMAGSDAPAEYVQWERLAESRKVGLWGQPVDVIVVPPHHRPPRPPSPPQPQKPKP